MSKRVSALDKAEGFFRTPSPAEAEKAVKEERKISRKEDPELELIKVNWQVRPDRLEALKILVAKRRMKIYEALDEALAGYLEVHVD